MGRSAHVAVVGTELEASGLAAALAGELRARARAGCALMLHWAPRELPSRRLRLPAPAAARLAARLAGRGLQTSAHGLLVLVMLPVDPREALIAADRVAAASDVPTVVALSGARPAAFDVLLREHALVVIADRGVDPRLTELARGGLHGVAARLVTAPPIAAGPPRWLAGAGLGRTPGLSDALGQGETT